MSITDEEAADIRGMFTPGSGVRPHIPPSTWTITPPPSRRFALERDESMAEDQRPRAHIVVSMPDGQQLQITTDKVEIEFSRDFVDASTSFAQSRTYTVSKGTFTIRGEL